jgi:hypothetical protein
MNRCLGERALLRNYLHEGTAAEQSHLRQCADCAERYELLTEDLETIDQALDAPPLAAEPRRAWPLRWVPAAAVGMAVVALLLGVAWLRRPAPVAAHPTGLAVFVADVSDALFATGEANALPQIAAAETSYLDAALDAGHPCTRERFLAGDCSDQLSALLIDSE